MTPDGGFPCKEKGCNGTLRQIARGVGQCTVCGQAYYITEWEI